MHLGCTASKSIYGGPIRVTGSGRNLVGVLSKGRHLSVEGDIQLVPNSCVKTYSGSLRVKICSRAKCHLAHPELAAAWRDFFATNYKEFALLQSKCLEKPQLEPLAHSPKVKFALSKCPSGNIGVSEKLHIEERVCAQ